MGHRWRGYEHPELYKMINTGPGAAASDPQTTYWQDLAKELTELDEDLNARLSQLGSRWEGAAAESATAGLTPLAEWASDAQTGATIMKISSEDQGQFVSDARSSMPPPVPVTTPAPSGWDIAKAAGAAALGFSGPAQDVAQQANDHEAQEAAQNEAELKAVETMQTYESSSTWNRNTLGSFIAPPDVVVSTPAPQGNTSGVIIGSTSVQSVSAEDPGAGTTTHKTTGGPQGTVLTPTVSGDQPSTTTGESGGGGGGGTAKPPTTSPGTTPSNLLVPPGPLPTPTPPPLPNPTPTPGPGLNPFLPGSPFFGTADVTGNNAGDIARRAMPLRPMPVETGPFGRAGLVVDGERIPSQVGRGGVVGGMPGEGGVVRTGPGAAGAAGRGGVHGPGGAAGAAGRRAEDEEDEEHYAADYLLEEDDVFGDDRRVSPSVLGE